MLFMKTLTGERIQDFEHSNLRYVWTYAFRNWDYICCFSKHGTYKAPYKNRKVCLNVQPTCHTQRVLNDVLQRTRRD